MRTNSFPHVAGLLLASSLLAAEAGAAVVYSDDFSGSSSTPLNGQAPDVRPGSQTWTSGNMNADGSIPAAGANSASLPYTFANDQVYSLSVTHDISYSASSTTALTLCFTQDSPLTSGNIVGGTRQTFALFGVFRGGGYNFQPGPRATVAATATGANNGLFSTPQDNLKQELVLTTSSSTNWTLAGYVNGVQVDLDTGTLGMLYTFASTPAFTGVTIGYGVTSQNVEGFEFSVVPEPMSVGVAGMCGMMLAARRRAARGR